MRSNICLTIFHASILAVLILPLDADGEDLKCETDIKIRRNTIYKSFVGGDLRINCTVAFCRRSPPIVSWLKTEKISVPVNVSSGSHIKTNWTTLTDSEGISFLIFTNILSNDSGEYQCSIGSSVSHINVSVYDDWRMTPTTWSNGTKNLTQDSFWIHVYGVVGVMAFAIIAVVVYVTPKPACKGESGPKTDPDPENRVSGLRPGSSPSV